MTYYLLQKRSKHYIVRNGYSTIAQLCRELTDKKPYIIKGSFYPGDKIGLSEVKNLLITVDLEKYKPFIGINDDYSHCLPFDNIY